MNKLTVMAIAIVALLAVTSGAFAAQKYVITSTKQIKPSVVQSLKGKQGVPGTSGATGDIGPQGSRGPTGSQGPEGSEGAPGSKGATGAKGESGAQGAPGPKGEAGSQGVKGDTGSTGATGTKGDTGATGSKGDTGSPGISGYQEVNVVKDFALTTTYKEYNVVATCPAGKRIISGGYWKPWVSSADTNVIYNGPGANDTAWSVSVQAVQGGGWASTLTIQAIAICGNIN
jgi:hypothetical protein